MNLLSLDEPELEFGSNARHIDIRFGLSNGGPLDVENPSTRAISVGMVGTAETIEKLVAWLDRCRVGIAAKPSPYPHLFSAFPGFNADVAFRSTLVLDKRFQRAIPERDFVSTFSTHRTLSVESAVDLLMNELRQMVEKGRPDVILCAPPFSVWEQVKDLPEAIVSEEVAAGPVEAPSPRVEFHDLLKARAMAVRVPVQLIWPHTYDAGKVRKQRRHPNRARGQQDEATRAWNLHTALYYKAGGLPWRLIRDPSDLTACCVGISFYHNLDRDRVRTSMAQVFNERGHGVVVRGSQVTISKEDLQPHLDESSAAELLVAALAAYRSEHKNLPARIVVHKTSRFSASESAGFLSAIQQSGIEQVDLLSLDESDIRLFREGEYCPLRGTMLTLDDRTHILYTRGSVDFFRTYPGMYVPVPLLFRTELSDHSPDFLGRELLSLTKMNWNSTQFDGHDPITVRAARQVGAILRHLDEADSVEPAYGYYM